MSDFVILVLVFIATGFGFLLVNLVVGRLVRPNKPDPEKGKIYECGEPTIGPSWIQFDLRFYVVALLFVIFDVEMAFFFPWATIFGSANKLAEENDPNARVALVAEMGGKMSADTAKQPPLPEDQAAAKKLARLAFVDILFFFGVLLVGFAYLWKRGDLEWVRSMAAQPPPPAIVPTASGGIT